MNNEWDLSSVNLHHVAAQKYEVAVLPMGATEPHNRHLPQGQDTRISEHIARRCCQAAWEKCHSVICLPPIPYGVDCNLMDFPLAIHVSQATIDQMVREIALSLLHYGIRKLVIVNGHGGNDFAPLARQLQCDHPIHLFLCDWWKVGHDRYKEFFQAPDDHAGEMETSVALAMYPELVELEAAGDGKARPFRFEALEKGWVRTSRTFRRLNDHCAVGDPSAATAAKGQQYLDLVCGRITQFLVELAGAKIDKNFPHKE